MPPHSSSWIYPLFLIHVLVPSIVIANSSLEVPPTTGEPDTNETSAEGRNDEVSDWIPVHLASIRPTKTWTDAPPIIITQEEPGIFDITIKHKIGAGVAADTSFKVTVPVPSSPSPTSTTHKVLPTPKASRSLLATRVPSNSEILGTTFFPIAELKVTIPLKPVAAPKLPSSVQESRSSTRDKLQVSLSSDTSSVSSSPSTPSVEETSITPTKASTIPISTSTEQVLLSTQRVINETKKLEPEDEKSDDIVYGKPAIGVNRPIAPSMPDVTSIESSSTTVQEKATTSLPPSYHRTPIASISPGHGRPFVMPVEVDEVKPKMGYSGPSVVTEPGQGSVYIDGRPTHFKILPVPSGPTLQVGSGVTVSVANDGNLAARGPSGHSRHSNNLLPRVNSSSFHSQHKPSTVRRPSFRPRPVLPLVRIDTCIVGDDSTCDVGMNERCKTELGISSCQCKPGFGRSTPRGMCNPIVTLSMSLRLDKLGDNKLLFTRNYLNPNSEEYQFLEYESIQGLNSLFSSSRLSKLFMGVKVNKFYSFGGKMLVNASIELENSNMTKTSGVRRVLQQELSRVLTLKNNTVGDSTLWVEPSSAAPITRVDDVNECSSSDLNDCSANAYCLNEFGSFRCICKRGYEDKFAGDHKKSGRSCLSCSPSYCSNRGECHIVNGEKECKCRGNFIGSQCDIDIEVLGVAVGGSVAALVIMVITFLCLYMWNQRWKTEQQKIEEMSAASARTFSYVNKQQVAGYRYAIDDRFRWPQVNEVNFYSQTPEHIMANASQQHVYATPSRVQTPEALLSDELFEARHNQYARPSRSKSRNSTLHGHPAYPANVRTYMCHDFEYPFN